MIAMMRTTYRMIGGGAFHDETEEHRNASLQVH